MIEAGRKSLMVQDIAPLKSHLLVRLKSHMHMSWSRVTGAPQSAKQVFHLLIMSGTSGIQARLCLFVLEHILGCLRHLVLKWKARPLVKDIAAPQLRSWQTIPTICLIVPSTTTGCLVLPRSTAADDHPLRIL